MNDVTLRQMNALIQVARHASFTKASAELHLTQSATSALIRELEQKLGLRLFDRTTRSVTLTRAGEEFCARAERIVADVAHAVSDTKDLVNKRRGLVSIAASPLASATFLPQGIAAFSKSHPFVRVQLHDMLTDGIIGAVRNGTAELGIGTFRRSVSEVEIVTLFEDRLGVVMSASASLAKKRRPTWRDVANGPRISLSHTSAFRPLVDNVFASLGIAPAPPRFEVSYMGTAVALVEAGLGHAILPERAASLARAQATLWRPLANPVVAHSSTLVTRAGRSLSPGARAFVEFLADQLQAKQRN